MMDNYIAVKTVLDFKINWIKFALTPYPGDDEEYASAWLSTLESFRATFMQEALLFDNIYIMWPNEPTKLFNELKSFAEGSGDIFSLIQPSDMVKEFHSINIAVLKKDDVKLLKQLLT